MRLMEIRPARIDDAARVAAVHARSWQAAYHGLLPQEFLDRIDPARRVPLWERLLAETCLPRRGTLVADEGGDLLGFVDFGPSRDDDTDPERTGEVRAIYLRPHAWHQGLGRQLMTAAAAYLTGAGFSEATLWVLDSNDRARRFYEACGWCVDEAHKQEAMPGFTVTEVRYRRPLP